MKKLAIKILVVLMFAPAILWAQDPNGKTFFIQSSQEYAKGSKDGFWDVPGDNLRFKSGQNLQVWNLGNTQGDRKYKFIYIGSWGGEKYYRIQPLYSYSASVDVSGNNHRNGGNIQIWENNNGEAQRFRLKHMGNGRWRIISTKGYVICLDNRSSRNGSNVHLWEDHNGPWMEWVLLDTRYKKPFGKTQGRVKEKKTRRSTRRN